MKPCGFTLAELLIALAILGVIATFAIPKVLNAQQDGRKNAVAKEAAAAVSEAYQAFQLENTVMSSTGMPDLTPYLNYVKFDTATVVDHKPGNSSVNCAGGTINCLKLHNGAILWYASAFGVFNGTDPTDKLFFLVDPDGIYNNGDVSGKAVEFALFTTGRLQSRGAMNNDPAADPPWFSWGN